MVKICKLWKKYVNYGKNMYIMVKICKLWQRYVNYGKNMVNFHKTPLGEIGCLGILYFCLLVPRHPVF